jgi:hypothetical protein
MVAGPLVKDLGVGNPRLKALDDAFAALGRPPAAAVLNLAETKPTRLTFGIETTVPCAHFLAIHLYGSISCPSLTVVCHVSPSSVGMPVPCLLWVVASQVVSVTSSRSQHGKFQVVNSDHIAICKPSADTDPTYKTVLTTVEAALER